MDLVDVPERRRDPSKNPDPYFHLLRTARFDRPSSPIYLINLKECRNQDPKSASRRFWDTGLNPTQRGRQFEVAISREQGSRIRDLRLSAMQGPATSELRQR